MDSGREWLLPSFGFVQLGSLIGDQKIVSRIVGVRCSGIPCRDVGHAPLTSVSNEEGFQNYIPFATRSASRTTEIVYQQPVTTYHAYNNYPNDGVRGKSIYDHNSHGDTTISGNTRAVMLSFDRPYADAGAYDYFLREHELVMFLEEHGYDVGYQTNIDVHRNPGCFDGAKLFISGGHDEYWTSQIYDRVETAKTGGINLAFFGANPAFWQIRLEPDSLGTPYRTLISYKDFSLDPEPDRTKRTITFRGIGRAEQQLVGVQYITYGDAASRTSFIAKNTDHWVFEGTGLTNGDHIDGIVGGEVDLLFPDYPQPVSTDYTVIGESPFSGAEFTDPVMSQSVIHRAPSGAWVFASGSLLWHQGLNHPFHRSVALRRMTTNMVDQFTDRTTPQIPVLGARENEVLENAGILPVTISLTPAAIMPVSFKIATTPGTAAQGEDFYGAFDRITIAPGVTSFTWPVSILNDDDIEPTESFRTQIWDIQNAASAGRYQTHSIIDDDRPVTPVLSIVDTVVWESNTTIYVRVLLSSPTNQTVSLQYSTTTGGTATPPGDYYGTSGRLVIPPMQGTITFPITINDDSDIEGPEYIRMQIYGATNATVARRYATLSIQDDDDPG